MNTEAMIFERIKEGAHEVICRRKEKSKIMKLCTNLKNERNN